MLYQDIIKRCKDSVVEYVPDMPKTNTLEAWENYISELESLGDEIYDHAHRDVESWDWTIYTHYGFKILDALPLEVNQQAESDFFELWGSEPIDTLNDPWDMASRIAYFALLYLWQDEAQEIVSELKELAENQIENLEG